MILITNSSEGQLPYYPLFKICRRAFDASAIGQESLHADSQVIALSEDIEVGRHSEEQHKAEFPAGGEYVSEIMRYLDTPRIRPLQFVSSPRGPFPTTLTAR